MTYLTSALLSKRRFRILVASLLILSTICVVFIVPLETQSPYGQITNYPDAIYWAINTITSTGYGDLVPVTFGGRIISSVLELGSASLFSIIFVLIGITMAQSAEHFRWHRTQERLDAIDKKLETLHKHVTFKP